MNLLEHYVTSINSLPEEAHGKWWVNVTYDCYGQQGTTDIMFETEQDAKEYRVGSMFLA